MNELRYDDGSRKYVTLGDYLKKRHPCWLCKGTGKGFPSNGRGQPTGLCTRCKGTGKC